MKYYWRFMALNILLAFVACTIEYTVPVLAPGMMLMHLAVLALMFVWFVEANR